MGKNSGAYKYEKRQKELARQKKKEEKRKRHLEKKQQKETEEHSPDGIPIVPFEEISHELDILDDEETI